LLIRRLRAFPVRLDAAAVGTFQCQLSLTSDDADESPFTLQLAGTVAVPPPPPATIIDDGNAGNTLVGAWRLKTGTGYGNDLRQAPKGTGSINAKWTFSNLAAGQYQVWVTYRISSVNATNAPFTLYNGSTTVRTVRINQRLTPASLQADGARWQSLGNVWINSGRLVVKLTNAANGQVVADAVRIERVVTSGACGGPRYIKSGATDRADHQQSASGNEHAQHVVAASAEARRIVRAPERGGSAPRNSPGSPGAIGDRSTRRRRVDMVGTAHAADLKLQLAQQEAPLTR
jgi:hypothetical protein